MWLDLSLRGDRRQTFAKTKGGFELKRVLSLLLTAVLTIGLFPAGLTNTAQAASGNFFVFPNESYDVDSARVVNTDEVDLTGSINNVNGNISYSVYQIVENDDGEWEAVTSNVGQTGGVTVDGFDLTVTDLQLYAGMNKITFKGTNGSKSVEESIYIEFRNGPTLSNLKASLSGETVDLSEDSTAVLTAAERSSDYGQDTADVIISGVAKNAQSVTVTVNGKSWTYKVSSYNDYKFTASSITVNEGKNLVTITATNGDQSVETTRELAFNNGTSTFYDTYLTASGSESPDLSTSPDFSVDSGDLGDLELTGKAIVPITGGTFSVDYIFSGGATGTGSVAATVESTDTDGGYTVISYTIDVPTAAFDDTVKVELNVMNSSDASDPVGEYNAYFTLRDSSMPYIYKINYLDGYNSNTTPSQALNLTGTAMSDTGFTDIYSLPAGFEVLVINGDNSTDVELDKITDSKGNTLNISGVDLEIINRKLATQTINGVQTDVMRIIVEMEELPSDGSQYITLSVGSSQKTVGATLLYGPYVQFDKLYDGQQISVDTTSVDSMNEDILDAVGDFAGTLFNIPNTNDIDYSGSDRTVYLYVNNTLVDLEETSAANKFQIADGDEKVATNAIITGSNVIKFVYKSGNSSYSKSVTINVIQTNVPEIPVDDTLGVIPFTTGSGYDIPDEKDPAFEGNDSTFTTKETDIKIFGTFDFLDLGGSETTVKNSIDDLDNPEDYILNITSSEDSEDSDGITWTLENELYSEEADKAYDSGKDDVDDLRVYYNEDDEYFSFVLINQELPTDGSPVVYNFTVTSNGATSTYRIEVVYERTVFNVVRPLSEKRILNQNFVEVVVSSETADSVTVDKEEAVKVEYDGDMDGDIDGDSDYPHAFRAIVTGLKANKETDIDIVVKEGDEELEETITVKYVPTNIPGAQYMAEMAKSHKVFDGALSLKFATGTSLIRRDYDLPEQLKNQVFSGHNIRFAIGNDEDGVVDRHEFEVDYDDYNYLVDAGQQYFISNFPDRFAKASSVFWIDAGIADDITTSDYDPITEGADPYQFEFSDIPSFYERDPENELVPSKRGELTLTYDSAMAQDAGRLVTVFHFDPENKEWENIGGVVNASKHTITIPFDRFGYYVVGKLSSSYTDIIDHSYGREYIETIFAKGVMNPVDPSTQFGVDKKITRAEFVRMIVRAKELALDYSGEQHFGDVPKTTVIDLDALWDYRFVETAARAGYIKGAQPGAFNPDGFITRQDASVVIAKALNLKLETDHDKITKDLQKYFKDYSTIDYYAQASVLAIAKKGFITGSPVNSSDETKGYNFNPESSTLRGDAAIIIAKVMIDQKKLPKM